jgi:hypothetical protein
LAHHGRGHIFVHVRTFYKVTPFTLKSRPVTPCPILTKSRQSSHDPVTIQSVQSAPLRFLLLLCGFLCGSSVDRLGSSVDPLCSSVACFSLVRLWLFCSSSPPYRGFLCGFSVALMWLLCGSSVAPLWLLLLLCGFLCGSSVDPLGSSVAPMCSSVASL